MEAGEGAARFSSAKMRLRSMWWLHGDRSLWIVLTDLTGLLPILKVKRHKDWLKSYWQCWMEGSERVTREINLSGYIMPSRPATSPESALTTPCSYDREPTFGNLRAGRSSGENCSTSYLKCGYSIVWKQLNLFEIREWRPGNCSGDNNCRANAKRKVSRHHII